MDLKFAHPHLSRFEWEALNSMVHGVKPYDIAYNFNTNIGSVRQQLASVRLKYKMKNVQILLDYLREVGIPNAPDRHA